MFLTVQAMQRFRKQLLQPLLLRSIKGFQRQAAGKHLFHLQFAQRFPLNAGQNAFTLGATAAHQQHFHRQRFGLLLNFSLDIVQVFIAGDFDIQPDRRLLRAILPLLKLFADAGEIAFQYRQRLGDRHRQQRHLAELALVE